MSRHFYILLPSTEGSTYGESDYIKKQSNNNRSGTALTVIQVYFVQERKVKRTGTYFLPDRLPSYFRHNIPLSSQVFITQAEKIVDDKSCKEKHKISNMELLIKNNAKSNKLKVVTLCHVDLHLQLIEKHTSEKVFCIKKINDIYFSSCSQFQI